MVTFSIILASRDGADTLPMTLEALTQVEPPQAEVEIILVDNASTDATPELMRAFADRIGGRFIQERRPGKSHALNVGIETASGELLVFMDDDVLPAPKWLKAFERGTDIYPNAAIFAGQVRPRWLTDAPAWLERLADDGRVCGCTKLGSMSRNYPGTLVKGGNLAVRADKAAGIRFDTSVSNFGSHRLPVGGEDTRFVLDVQTRGGEIVFLPDALVFHVVQRTEMAILSLVKREMRIGASTAAVRESEPALLALGRAAVLTALSGINFILDRRYASRSYLLRAARNVGKLTFSIGRRRRSDAGSGKES